MATTIETTPTPSTLDRPLWSAIALDWEKAAYLALIVAAIATRFYRLGDRVMSHDESLHTQFAWYLYQGRGFQHSPLMHGVLRFELTAFTYWLLGDNDYTSRVPGAIMGVVAVGLMYYFRRSLGRAGALVAALLMVISPYMLYYSRYIRDEPYVVVWGLLMALCVNNYMEKRQTNYLYWLTAVTALFYATMETSFIYIAITMTFLGLHIAREWYSVPWPRAEYQGRYRLVINLTLIALLVAAAAVAIHFLQTSSGTLNAEATAVPANPAEELAGSASAFAALSVPLRVAVIAGGVVGLGVLVASALAFAGFGQEVRRFPALDLLVVLGIFALPQLAAFPVRALGKDPLDYNLPAGGPFFSTNAGVTLIVVLTLFAISAAIAWWWDWRKALVGSGIFYGIYIPLFTTFFTNGGGVATGVVGSLGYWLAQHPVQRGNQPWYYYPVITLPVYEYLPVIGALFALGIGIARWLRVEDEAAAEQENPERPRETLAFPVIGLFGFWSVAALVGFSAAGEKMPWLTTHITLPLILVSGWAIGRFIDATDWQAFRERRAWLVVILLPLTVLSVASVFGFGQGGLLGNQPPFQGSQLPQLQATAAFVSALIVAAICLAAVYFLGRDVGWNNVGRLAGLSFFGLLAVLTMRTAFIATYINYDSANEFLVYAHGARGVKTVMEQVDEIAARTMDNGPLKVAYDSDVSWPMTWYLRYYDQRSYGFYGENPTREGLNTPVVIAGPKHWSKVEALLGDRYYKFEYIRMVWPMQDYFNLTWERIRDAWSQASYRQAFWNIWFNRDYKLYGEQTKTNFDLSQWPVAERMHFYVRKDLAAQMWGYGVGPATLGTGVQEDPYARSRQTLAALTTWGVQGNALGSFDAPRGLARGPDGSIYVADSRNHRIQKFDANGELLTAWGSFGSLEQNTAGPGLFNEPWGLAVGPDGSVYVADTWNHRIQKFDAGGNFIKAWGRFGQAETFDAMWGPRAVAVDAQGRVFVADTGNKRIVVFDRDGNGLTSVGASGFEPGFLDEPVGLALAPDGALYVADTWNQRVQVFQPDAGAGDYIFAKEWKIEGWFGQSLDNKPYLALDANGRLYVTDPEGYRVLVFDKDGNFVTTWGDFGSDVTTFGLASGIVVDEAGNIYVADSANNRVMKFPLLK